MRETVRVTAPAKVNLFLAVGDLRADGYHDVTTVTQTLSLADVVTLEPADTLELVCDAELDVSPKENLAYRAARAFGDAVGRPPSARITLVKVIPAGAGLGGASSDAAAVIAGLAHAWEIDPGDSRLVDTAAGLGADVPLFLHGGANLLGGRGDELIEHIESPECAVVVVWPQEAVPTAEAYRAFDRTPRMPTPGPDAVLEACRSGACRDVAKALHNNMTDASVGLVPGIADALAWASDAPETLGAVMAGSGSAVCAVCVSDAEAAACSARARAEGWWARDARMVPSGVAVHTEKGRT